MNQAEDKKLKELFQELGQEDKRLAPPFAKTWGAGLSQVREKKANRPSYVFQFATAAILLMVLAIVIVGIFWHEHNQEGGKSLTANATMVNPPVEPPKVIQPQPVVISKSTPAEKFVTMRRRQSFPRSRPALVSLSQWHSPTDFLLKSSNDQLLRTIPKLSELPKEIRLDTEK